MEWEHWLLSPSAFYPPCQIWKCLNSLSRWGILPCTLLKKSRTWASFCISLSSHSPHPVNKFGVKTVLQELLASPISVLVQARYWLLTTRLQNVSFASNILNSLNKNYLNYQSFFTCAPFVVYCNFFWNNCRHITSFSLNVSSFTVRKTPHSFLYSVSVFHSDLHRQLFRSVLNAWLSPTH